MQVTSQATKYDDYIAVSDARAKSFNHVAGVLFERTFRAKSQRKLSETRSRSAPLREKALPQK